MPTTRRRRALFDTSLTWLLRAAVIALVLGWWYYGVGPGDVSPLLLPQPLSVAKEFGSVLVDPETYAAAWVTLQEFVTALAIATAVGLAIGFVSSRSRLRSDVASPVLTWGYLAPLELLLPIMIVWFGVGMTSKIVYAALAATFPIAINTIRGFSSVSPHYLKVSKAYGASTLQTELTVKFHAAFPIVLSGLRIGMASCMISVILAEILASNRGLGSEIVRASQNFNTVHAFAMIMFLIAFIGVFHTVVERFTTPKWQR